VTVTEGVRMSSQAEIRRYIDEVARTYNVTPRF
jgi:hypothetical protein